MTEPNQREDVIAAEWLTLDVPSGDYTEHVARLLSAYRASLLEPFEKLRRDYEALGEERAARYLDRLLQAARKGEA